MDNRSIRGMFVIVGLAVLLGSGSGAFAQQAEGEDLVLEEVIVTASKREESLLEVPMAVQAFSGQEIERAAIRELNEVIHLIPGASEGRTTNVNARTYQIRGVAAYYGESTVGYYLDEAAYAIPNRNWAPVAPTFDLERIEVLRGPQGTLYGLGSMGGTIRFITRDPDLERFEFKGIAGWSDTDGGDDNYNAEAVANIPLIRDKLGMRVLGSVTHRGGFASSPTFPDELDEDKVENYRIKIMGRPSDDFVVKLAYQKVKGTDDWGKQYFTVDPAGFPPSMLLGEPIRGENENDIDVLTAFLSWTGEGVIFESSTGYIDRSGFGRVPLAVGIPGVYPILDVGGGADMFTQEVRLLSNTDDAFQWIGGAVFQKAENVETVRLVGAPPFPAPFPLFRFRDGVTTFDSENWALFGEVSNAWMGGKLVGLLGLRYFQDDRSFQDVNVPPGPIFPPGAPAPPPPPASVFESSDTFDSWNPRFNLSYRPDDRSNYYVNIAKGFRSGTFNTQAGANATPLAGLFVDPDELWSYEVGGKWNFTNAVSFEVAMYYLDWQDAQMNFSAPGQIQVIANAADISGYGIDYLLNWSTPVDGLRFHLSGNFNSTEYDEVKDPVAFTGTSVVEGDQVANVPEMTASAMVSFIRPLSDSMSLDMLLSYTYIDDQGDPTNTFRGDSQNLLRARAGLRWDNFGVYFVGTNLLDSDDAIQISGSGSTLNYPRTLGLEVTFQY